MNRRSLFGKFAAVAAVAAVGPAVEASASEPQSDLWFSDSAIKRGDGPSGWRLNDRGERVYLVDGVEQGVGNPPLYEAPDEAYMRGYEQATLRAENRVALGLPLVHAPDEDEDETPRD